jgi:hypothetical protein
LVDHDRSWRRSRRSGRRRDDNRRSRRGWRRLWSYNRGRRVFNGLFCLRFHYAFTLKGLYWSRNRCRHLLLILLVTISNLSVI